MKAYTLKHVEDYLLNAIDSEPYEVECSTDKEKIKFLYDTFKSEKGYEIKRFGELQAIEDWLKGLPTAINIEFENYKILELAIEFGQLDENSSEQDQNIALENYFPFMALKLFKLIKKTL